MNNIDNNRLISIFMGTEFMSTFCSPITPLNFHTSWDWLMPVVEKIETLFNDGIDVDIFSDGTVITQYRFEENGYLTEGKEIVRLTKAEIGFNTKIEHTYQAVVEFIKWYNNQTK